MKTTILSIVLLMSGIAAQAQDIIWKHPTINFGNVFVSADKVCLSDVDGKLHATATFCIPGPGQGGACIAHNNVSLSTSMEYNLCIGEGQGSCKVITTKYANPYTVTGVIASGQASGTPVSYKKASFATCPTAN